MSTTEENNQTPDGTTNPLRCPLTRDVARPVANLGNTCYMNAVLQALAHAPELCMAMDVEPHHLNCPIYQENSQKRRSSPSSSPDAEELLMKSTGTRKSRRSSGKKSPTNGDDTELKFCALCEVEQHLARVHMDTNNRDKPVAPTAFVNGFINDVAPYFKLGQQEDSHEFLRLLIDAMQKSCKQARPSPNPQDTPPESTGEENEDVEYPFQLFRGTVQSEVICESCQSKRATLDPIEDIGLDVSPISSGASSSPTPGALADVSSALQRFARAEALDAGYKCEKCGKVGKATKQSRLASIPPILTLHLKRFRYGADAQKANPVAAGPSSRRSNRSELNQLLGSGSSDFFAGKSGSAKIEGHSKFEQILDLKPYLTQALQDKHSKMFCRLFAVIVHAGKNSHSGHYISYVRNIAKNEWWKMDDSRITVASIQEVMNAEAYMLFYRVVEHPFVIELRNQEKKMREEFIKENTKSLRNENFEDERTRSDVPVKSEDNTNQNKNRSNNGRKRKAPTYTCGEDWANAKTSLPRNVVETFRSVEDMISEYVQFKPEFFKMLTDQASRANARVGHGPSSGICADDIDGGTEKVKAALLRMFYEIEKQQGVKYYLRSRVKEEPAINVMVDPDDNAFL